jgi:dipeptidase E
MKIVACGRGRVVQSAAALAEVLRLAGKPASSLNLLYLGTASFEDRGAFEAQTAGFAAAGCSAISQLRLTRPSHTPPDAERRRLVERADVIVVSGGNTLFAVRRWHELGVDDLLRSAAARGCVMAGGSAGAIVWFGGGHSDSMDPATVLDADLDALGAEALASWRYIKVNGLGLISGTTLCPHHDTTQSNGLLRSRDFDEMLLRGDCGDDAVGICVEDQATLVIEGDSYWTVASGATMVDGAAANGASAAAKCFVKRVVDGVVISAQLTEGSVREWR